MLHQAKLFTKPLATEPVDRRNQDRLVRLYKAAKSRNYAALRADHFNFDDFNLDFIINNKKVRLATAILLSADEQMRTYLYGKHVLDFYKNKKLSYTDSIDRTLLHWAVHCKQPCKVLETIIKAGADVNAVSIGDITPTHLAAYTGNLDAIFLLHENHADLNLKTQQGATVLDYFDEDDMMQTLYLLGGRSGLDKDYKPQGSAFRNS